MSEPRERPSHIQSHDWCIVHYAIRRGRCCVEVWGDPFHPDPRPCEWIANDTR